MDQEIQVLAQEAHSQHHDLLLLSQDPCNPSPLTLHHDQACSQELVALWQPVWLSVRVQRSPIKLSEASWVPVIQPCTYSSCHLKTGQCSLNSNLSNNSNSCHVWEKSINSPSVLKRTKVICRAAKTFQISLRNANKNQELSDYR